MKKSDQIHFWLSILLAFMMPLYQNFVPIIIVLIALNWLSRGKKAFEFHNLKSSWSLLALIGYYLWHILGLFWSENLSFGWFDLQIKLPFLLLPLIYSSYKPFDRDQFEKIIWGFMAGCLAAITMGLANSVYTYYTGESPILNFYEENITPVLHIGYFAMYLNLGLLLSIYLVLKGEERFYTPKSAGLILIALLFATATFLSTARNGFLVLILVILFLGLYAIIKYRKWLVAVISLLVLWISASILLKDVGLRESSLHGFDYVVNLAEKKGEVTAQEWESTAVRVLLWRTAVELIEENPLLGTGTGDIKDELIKIYKERDYIYIIDKQLNIHNQFLQSWAALGPLGLLLSLMCFLLPFYYAIKRHNLVLGLFAVIVGFSCLTECILEVQAGVVFLAFFLTNFSIASQNDGFVELNTKLK